MAAERDLEQIAEAVNVLVVQDHRRQCADQAAAETARAADQHGAADVCNESARGGRGSATDAVEYARRYSAPDLRTRGPTQCPAECQFDERAEIELIADAVHQVPDLCARTGYRTGQATDHGGVDGPVQRGTTGSADCRLLTHLRGEPRGGGTHRLLGLESIGQRLGASALEEQQHVEGELCAERDSCGDQQMLNLHGGVGGVVTLLAQALAHGSLRAHGLQHRLVPFRHAIPGGTADGLFGARRLGLVSVGRYGDLAVGQQVRVSVAAHAADIGPRPVSQDQVPHGSGHLDQ